MKTRSLLAAVMMSVAPVVAMADCFTLTGDTVYCTVGADGCGATVAAVLTSLTSDATYYAGGALKKDVVMLLDDASQYSVSIAGFNASSTGRTLTIRPVSPARRAKLSSLSVTGSKGVRIANCDMQLSGATGLTVSGSEDVILENNAIAVALPSATPASDVALNITGSSKVQLLRNTLRGEHATLLQIAGSTQVLVMNNILWSDNTNANATYQTALIRLDGDAAAVGQVGVYYNTLYIAPGTNTTQKVDFFAMGRYGNAAAYGHQANYLTGSIGIQYNNCISYSTSVSGRTANAFVVRTDASTGTSDLLPALSANMRKNNFWSKYDAAQSNTASVFAPGVEADVFVAADANLCAAAPTAPSDLVVSGTGFNSGYSLTRDHSGLSGLSRSDDNIRTGNIRPRTGMADVTVLSDDIATIVMLVSASGATTTHDIDLTGFHIGSGNVVTAALTGTDAANFALSGTTSFAADSEGNVATGTTTVTFTGPAQQGEFDAAVRYTFTSSNAALTFDVPLLGVRADNPGDGWTLGAYQQGLAIPTVTEIVWQGDYSSDWDERANWIVASTGLPLTCADPLSGTYTATIPAATSATYHVPGDGISNHPVIPAFGERSKAAGEQVNASGSKLASVIRTEYGAPLRGVENLDGHYDYAVSDLTVGRDGWVLVGPSVRPFESGTSGAVRNAMSGDFYLDYKPHVYIHEAIIDNGTAAWGGTSSDMYVSLTPTRSFAIRIPNEYGNVNTHLPDWYYYKRKEPDPTKLNDGSVDKTFTFTGKFYNDAALPSYTDLTAGTPVILTNTYPANMAVNQLSGGTVQIYNYSSKSFVTAESGDEILSQHGFVFTPSGTSLSVPAAAFTGSSTSYRNAVVDVPVFYVDATNESAGVSSRAGFRLADKEEDAIDWNVDAPKIFNANEDALPDLYVIRYDKSWQRVDVPTETETLPLGIRMNTTGNVRLAASDKSTLDAQVYLEDRQTGTVYDLTAGEACYVSGLEAGTTEGRFYLQMAPAAPTSVKAVEDSEGAAGDALIDIFQSGKMLTISASAGLSLQSLELFDMSGRMVRTELSGGQLQHVSLSVAPGVYVARVVAGAAEKKVKIVVK